MITLARDFNFSLGTSVDEYFNSTRRFRSLKKYPRPEVRTPAVEYLKSRGISRSIAEQYSITTQKDHDNILVFPFFDDSGVMQFIKYRKTNFDKSRDQNKEWCEANCKPILFGMDQCKSENSTLILTEGQLDSLSVAEAGIENAVSVPTGAKGFTWVPYCWDFLQKFNTLIIFGDHEKGKITLLEEMQKRFHGTVKHVRPEDYKDCKDANEILQTHGPQAIRDAVRNAVIVDNPHIKKLSDVKRRNMSELEHFSTGIQTLDKTIGGFYFGQFIILTGERGLGKSTLGSQFILSAINQEYTAFCYSGELMDWYFQDWMDRQAAGPLQINTLTSNLGFEQFMVDGQYINRIHDWYSERCYLYDNAVLQDSDTEEQETLIQTTENAIKQYGCRVLIIDNLMTAMQDDVRNDFYRQQTEFAKSLALMAKRYNVLIILIAHPRKSNGYEFRNDDVSGSGNITNLADVVLQYTEPKRDEDGNTSCDRILRVTKNRLTGKLNFDGIELFFDEPSKRIAEEPQFNWSLGWQTEDIPEGFVSVGEQEEIPF